MYRARHALPDSFTQDAISHPKQILLTYSNILLFPPWDVVRASWLIDPPYGIIPECKHYIPPIPQIDKQYLGHNILIGNGSVKTLT